MPADAKPPKWYRSTGVDLIACRNLLIDLEPPAQQKVLSFFHFSLNHDGVLFLGPSATRARERKRPLPPPPDIGGRRVARQGSSSWRTTPTAGSSCASSSSRRGSSAARPRRASPPSNSPRSSSLTSSWSISGCPSWTRLEVARRIRNPDNAHIRLIAVTGYGQVADRTTTRAAGCDEHLVKPVQGEELLAILGEWRGRGARTAPHGAAADPGISA
jgi:hypothetical protein